MIRTNTKDTVIVDGGEQNFDFENDSNGSINARNKVEITENISTITCLGLIDSLDNGFKFAYKGNLDDSKNTLGLYAIVDNVLITQLFLKSIKKLKNLLLTILFLLKILAVTLLAMFLLLI